MSGTRKILVTVGTLVAAFLVIGRGLVEVKKLLDAQGGDAARALGSALPWLVFFGVVILLGLALTHGVAWRDERVRRSLEAQPEIMGAVLVETDISTSQGLRSAYPGRFQTTSSEIVPSWSVLTWSPEGISLWHTIYRDKPIFELPWTAVSLGISRLLVGRSVRPALDVQLDGGPIHLQLAVRQVDGLRLRFDTIEQVQAMIARMLETARGMGGSNVDASNGAS